MKLVQSHCVFNISIAQGALFKLVVNEDASNIGIKSKYLEFLMATFKSQFHYDQITVPCYCLHVQLFTSLTYDIRFEANC